MSFYFLAGILLFSAVMVVTLHNIFHCALFLTAALISLAGIYFYLNAPLLGAMQLIIYVGAIMILVIFAIMLTSRISDRLLRASNRQVIPALLTLAAALYLSIDALRKTAFPQNLGQTFDPIYDLGRELLTTYLLPFELISLILLVGLVGAIVVARRD